MELAHISVLITIEIDHIWMKIDQAIANLLKIF